MSDSDSLRLEIQADPYFLLRTYAKQSKILSYAYSLSENYYRTLYKFLNYPLVVISAVSTVIAGFDLNPYVLTGLSLSMLILLGFDKLINPIDRSHRANQFKIEYSEISANVKNFILNNNRTRNEIKSYSSQIHEMLNKWKSMNPSISGSFIIQANLKYTPKIRKHKSIIIPPPSPKSDKKKRLSDGMLLSNIVVNV